MDPRNQISRISGSGAPRQHRSERPLVERKAHLKKLIDGTDIRFSESFEIAGREMFNNLPAAAGCRPR
jgi:hypothetical protein